MEIEIPSFCIERADSVYCLMELEIEIEVDTASLSCCSEGAESLCTLSNGSQEWKVLNLSSKRGVKFEYFNEIIQFPKILHLNLMKGKVSTSLIFHVSVSCLIYHPS
jgi:hypothetical protein